MLVTTTQFTSSVLLAFEKPQYRSQNIPCTFWLCFAPVLTHCAKNQCNCTFQKVLQGWDLVDSPASDETTHLIVEIQLCIDKHNSIRPITQLVNCVVVTNICLFIILCIFTMSVTSSSVSHSTLSTASSRMDIQSSDLDVRTTRHSFSMREDF